MDQKMNHQGGLSLAEQLKSALLKEAQEAENLKNDTSNIFNDEVPPVIEPAAHAHIPQQKQDQDQDQEDEIEIENNEESFSTQPFAGLIEQSITVIVGVGSGDAENINDLNFQNPFSKKGGVAREFIAGILPQMTDLANREVLLITDNFYNSSGAIISLLTKNSSTQLDKMFGSSNSRDESFFVSLSLIGASSKEAYDKLIIDTTIAVNMPALTDLKNDVAIRNTLLYWDRLKQDNPNIKFRLVVGFTTEELIRTNSRLSFTEFQEKTEEGYFNLILRSDSHMLALYGFTDEQANNLFEDFDVLFVST